MLKFYGYDRCDTCRRAKKWLTAQGSDFESIDITTAPPSLEELKRLVALSGQPLTAFFNRSGESYRKLNLKDKMKDLSDAEKLRLLASDGRLIKRPLATDGKRASVGFDEAKFQELWV